MAGFLLRILLLPCFLTLLTATAQAQGENANWHFGCYGGLRFEDGSVTRIESSLQSREGTASVSNAAGELQFYTDGITIFNADHEPVVNGLLGHPSSTSAAVVIPVRNFPDHYWIFTSDYINGNDGINYYRYDSGAERIIEGPVNMIARNTEKLAALKACGRENYWLATLDETGNYSIYDVGETITLQSTLATRTTDFNRRQLIGYLKFSEDGTKLASAIPDDASGSLGGIVQVFDFDPLTGEITNGNRPDVLNFNQDERGEAIGFPYGLQFSPSGEFLYVSTAANSDPSTGGGELYQFDVSIPNPNSSRTLIGSASQKNILYGALQLAPDGKIYMGMEAGNEITSSCACYESRQYLGVIQQPDARGTAAGFVQDGLFLGGEERADRCSYTSSGRTKLGLPTFIAASTLPPSINSITDTTVCGATALRLLRGNPQPGVSYTITAPGFTSQDYFTSVAPAQTTTYTITASSSDCTQNSSQVTISIGTSLAGYRTAVTDVLTCDNTLGSILIYPPDASPGDRFAVSYRLADSTVVTDTIEVDETGALTLAQLPAGTYSEFAITSSNACTVLLPESVTISESENLSTPTILREGGACAGATISLYADTTLGGQFAWSGPAGFTASSFSITFPSVSARNEGLYTLTRRLNDCISSPDSFTLSLDSLPTGLGFDTTGCTSVSLDVDYPYAELEWLDGSPPGPRLVTSDGLYGFSILTQDGCFAKDSIRVNLTPLPESTLPDQLIVEGCSEITLNPGFPSSPSLRMAWSGDYEVCKDCLAPTLVPDRSGALSLTISDTGTGCVRTDSVRITLAEGEGYYVPNAFSPNGDGRNEGFTVYTCDKNATVLSLNIFDRWGDQLFHRENFPANDPLLGWLGNAPEDSSTRPLNGGVFAYYILLLLDGGTEVELKGLVHSIR